MQDNAQIKQMEQQQNTQHNQHNEHSQKQAQKDAIALRNDWSNWKKIQMKWRHDMSWLRKFFVISAIVLIAIVLFNRSFMFYGFDLQILASAYCLLFACYGIFDGENIFTENYHPDPFDIFHIEENTLRLGKHSFDISEIKKVAISVDDKHGHFSLPFNYVNGQVPAISFDKGFYLAVSNYVVAKMPNVTIIE